MVYVVTPVSAVNNLVNDRRKMTVTYIYEQRISLEAVSHTAGYMAGTKQQLYLLNILGTRNMMQKLNATSGYLNIFHCFPPKNWEWTFT